jgi:predicted RNA-binding protein
MCEFTVFLNGESIWSDVVYAKTTGSDIILSDVLGERRIASNCSILEVDVQSERLVLEKN